MCSYISSDFETVLLVLRPNCLALSKFYGWSIFLLKVCTSPKLFAQCDFMFIARLDVELGI